MKYISAHKINKFKIIPSVVLLLLLISAISASKEVKARTMTIIKCTKLISIGKYPPLSGYEKAWLEIKFGKNGVQDTGYVLWLFGNEADSTMIGKFVNITYEPDSVLGIIGDYRFERKYGKIIKYIKINHACK